MCVLCIHSLSFLQSFSFNWWWMADVWLSTIESQLFTTYSQTSGQTHLLDSMWIHPSFNFRNEKNVQWLNQLLKRSPQEILLHFDFPFGGWHLSRTILMLVELLLWCQGWTLEVIHCNTVFSLHCHRYSVFRGELWAWLGPSLHSLTSKHRLHLPPSPAQPPPARVSQHNAPAPDGHNLCPIKNNSTEQKTSRIRDFVPQWIWKWWPAAWAVCISVSCLRVRSIITRDKASLDIVPSSVSVITRFIV